MSFIQHVFIFNTFLFMFIKPKIMAVSGWLFFLSRTTDDILDIYNEVIHLSSLGIIADGWMEFNSMDISSIPEGNFICSIFLM